MRRLPTMRIDLTDNHRLSFEYGKHNARLIKLTKIGDNYMAAINTLFQAINLDTKLNLSNRVVMAPLTRGKADDTLTPTEDMADYYSRRADGKIFAQLCHTGRVSRSIYNHGLPPFGPSAVPSISVTPSTDGVIYETPRAMNSKNIEDTIQHFISAAKNAREAGFDGVEIHGANGYLIDQFMHWSSNKRTDEYGQTNKNMSRFLLQIVDAVKEVVPEQPVGLRLSPQAHIHIEHDDRDKEVFEYLLGELNQYNLAYIHTGMFIDANIPHLGGTVTQFIRKHYQGNVIACGGYTAKSAQETLSRGDADLVAIGRPFIANPDYIERVRKNEPVKDFHEELLKTLY